MITGSIESSANRRRLITFPRPTYSNTNTSQLAGRTPMNSQRARVQKNLLSKSGLSSSRA